jgi:hypothetical protein
MIFRSTFFASAISGRAVPPRLTFPPPCNGLLRLKQSELESCHAIVLTARCGNEQSFSSASLKLEKNPFRRFRDDDQRKSTS